MGATHFQIRRLRNVHTEMALHVLAYNIKRMIVEENALGGTVEVLVLTGAKTPEEAAKADDAEDKARRDEECERTHACLARDAAGCDGTGRTAPRAAWLAPSLSALPTTRIDDADIATAATRGVTKPATATGTAMQL